MRSQQDNPALQEMEPDVEALLVNRIGHARGFSDPEYYIVPIDECFKLVGLIRTRWQGLRAEPKSGGRSASSSATSRPTVAAEAGPRA